MNRIKEMNDAHKRRVADVMGSMLKDFNEIGLALGSNEQVNELVIFCACLLTIFSVEFAFLQ